MYLLTGMLTPCIDDLRHALASFQHGYPAPGLPFSTVTTK
jgi:hypothetical protein